MRGRMLVVAALTGTLVTSVSGSQAATKPEHGYVTNDLRLPVSAQEAEDFGRDLDSDGTKDNQLGNVLTALVQSGGPDLSLATQEAILSGDIVMLHSLRTFSLANSKTATWQVWYGEPTVDPDLSGNGTFELLAGQPHSVRLDTTIKDHLVRTGAGKIPLRLDFGAGPFTLKLVKAKVVTHCFRSGCVNGKLNGAVSKAQIEGKFLPEFVEWINAAVAADCPGEDPTSCTPDSTGETLVGIFNEELADLVMTVDEALTNPFLQTILRPDLDLLDGDDLPGEELADHMSFGVGFETVKATLTRP